MKIEISIEEAKREQQKLGHRGYSGPALQGERTVIPFGTKLYPEALIHIPNPPACLYTIGNPSAMQEGIAVIGARRATPYGLACARHFAGIAAEQGICIISGGAYGCDSAAHEAALKHDCQTVVFLGGGCNQLYPARHAGMFQDIVNAGGVLVSEHEWDYPCLPHNFRLRNRLIAGLARATLIVEAGLPSGTFSTADEALAAGKEVMVVPGAITSPTSAGSNRLLYQGALPIVDDESFKDALFRLFSCLKLEDMKSSQGAKKRVPLGTDPLLEALLAQPMRFDQIISTIRPPQSTQDAHTWLVTRLAELECSGRICRYPDGRYGPAQIG